MANRWLADELGIGEGDEVVVTYSELAPGDTFAPRTRTFRVRGVLEMDAIADEVALAPKFPGLSDVDSCADWDIGLTSDEEALEDEANEAYWQEFRETPKAFVTLAAGRDMWGNRFGDLMGVRYSAAATSVDDLRSRLRQRVAPESVGLVLRPVRDEAERAASESMDLGQLFLGMSFFLILASLLLTAMLFVFSIEQRAREMGVLLAVGFTPQAVRRLFLQEGLLLSLTGSVLGIPLGFLFAGGLMNGLASGWSGAIADAAVTFHATPMSAVIGAVAGTVVSLLAMSIALWRQAKQPVRQLLVEDFSQAVTGVGKKAKSACGPEGVARHPVAIAILSATTVAALGLVGFTIATGSDNPAGAFFGAGFLMLIAGICFVRLLLARIGASAPAGAVRSTGDVASIRGLGIRGATRRPGRGLATTAMLASGVFMVLSVSAMQENLDRQEGEPRSGTGGFELYGESSLAIHEEILGPEGREEYRLRDEDLLEGVSIVPLRVRDGDDASCLNLNQSLTPPLLGVRGSDLTERGAFTGPDGAAELFSLLDRELEDRVVPAIIGDSATAMWKLRMPVGLESGAELEYLDERGEPFRVKLVAAIPQRLTVLQGQLLISDTHFAERFPSESGHRAFLVDTPEGRSTEVADYLAERVADMGLDLVPAVERLERFYVVESTYLSMFVVLGGLGLLLGTAGMGVLVLRNVMERRSELATLRAVGFSRAMVRALVGAEHRFLLLAGLAAGTVASALALAPSLLRPEARVPYGLLAGFLIGTAVLSVLWIAIATRAALRGTLVAALRSE